MLGSKRLELLMDALPGMRRVAVIWSRSIAAYSAIFDAIREAAGVRSIEIFSREFQGANDLSSAFEDAKASGAQAAIFMSDNVTFGRRKEVAALALANHLPSIHSFVPEADDGGLMSFGPDLDESYRRAAALADAILKGARPSDLPVEEPTRFILAVNLKTAAALTITIPPAILGRADKVIE
jgi:putative ABC transport system substrate-binding protein